MTDPLVVNYPLDVLGSGRLEKRLTTAVPEPDGRLIIDLSDCSFVASSGLRVMLKKAQIMHRDNEGTLVIVGANSTVLQVFKVSGFDKLMEVQK